MNIFSISKMEITILSTNTSQDRDANLLNKSLDHMINYFYYTVHNGIKQFIPLKRLRPMSTYPIWFSKNPIQLIKLKTELHCKYRQSYSNVDYIRFSEIRKQCKDLSILCYNDYITKTENNISGNAKYFWRFVNECRKSNELPNYMTYNNKKLQTGQDIANGFSDYFSTVYTNETLPSQHFSSPNNRSCSFSISLEEILSKISSLENNPNPGPDGIP